MIESHADHFRMKNLPFQLLQTIFEDENDQKEAQNDTSKQRKQCFESKILIVDDEPFNVLGLQLMID